MDVRLSVIIAHPSLRLFLDVVQQVYHAQKMHRIDLYWQMVQTHCPPIVQHQNVLYYVNNVHHHQTHYHCV